MEKVNELCLDRLEKLLSGNFNSSYYSLCGNAESAVCLDRTSDGWKVYNYERGEFNAVNMKTVVEAGLEVIRRLASSEDVDRLTEEFLKSIIDKAA